MRLWRLTATRKDGRELNVVVLSETQEGAMRIADGIHHGFWNSWEIAGSFDAVTSKNCFHFIQ